MHIMVPRGATLYARNADGSPGAYVMRTALAFRCDATVNAANPNFLDFEDETHGALVVHKDDVIML